MSNLRSPTSPEQSAAFIATVQAAADYQDREAQRNVRQLQINPNPNYGPCFQTPEKRPNDHAKHLRLVAMALREEAGR